MTKQEELVESRAEEKVYTNKIINIIRPKKICVLGNGLKNFR